MYPLLLWPYCHINLPTTEQTLKQTYKNLICPRKKYLTYDQNFSCTHSGKLLKLIQISSELINFCVMYSQTNIQVERQTIFTLSHGNKLAMVSKWKGSLYNNNKKYMHIYIQIGAFVQKLPAIKRIASTKIPDFF